MKNTGLQNRFAEQDRAEWVYHYSCHLCERNRWDVLHHIISPSVRWYVPGDHNKSVLNSAPLHNYPCHIGNEAELGREETIQRFLRQTFSVMTEDNDRRLTHVDKMFVRTYAALYDFDTMYLPQRGRILIDNLFAHE